MYSISEIILNYSTLIFWELENVHWRIQNNKNQNYLIVKLLNLDLFQRKKEKRTVFGINNYIRNLHIEMHENVIIFIR